VTEKCATHLSPHPLKSPIVVLQTITRLDRIAEPC
jgi:hypothetical protein